MTISWLGDPAAAARKARVPLSAAAVAARAHGARPFPAACVNVLTLTNKEDFDVDAVVSVLESDPPMCARVLRLVNSSAFALRSRCTSIRMTVSLLGSRGIRAAVLAGSVLNLFPGAESPERTLLHSHATRVATLARHLAPNWNLPPDEMFTTAFLHDIGKWILLDTEPGYADVIARFGHDAEATLDEERGRFGYDHAELSEHMLNHWRIPEPIPRVVGLHHDPAAGYAAVSKIAVRVAVLRLSNLLAHVAEDGSAPDFEALASEEPATYLGLSAGALEEHFAFLREVQGEQATPNRSASSAPAPPVIVLPAASLEEDLAALVGGTLLAGPKASYGLAASGLAATAAAYAVAGPVWPAALPAAATAVLAILCTWLRRQLRRNLALRRLAARQRAPWVPPGAERGG